MLQEMSLFDYHCQPVLLSVGRSRNQLIWPDTAFLIVLWWLAHTNSWDNL